MAVVILYGLAMILQVLHGSEMAFFLDASQNMESPDEVINLKVMREADGSSIAARSHSLLPCLACCCPPELQYH